MNSKDSKCTSVRKKFETKKIWTVSDLHDELKKIYPNEAEKTLRHRIRSALNYLRQTNEIRRLSPSTWEKL